MAGSHFAAVERENLTKESGRYERAQDVARDADPNKR